MGGRWSGGREEEVRGREVDTGSVTNRVAYRRLESQLRLICQMSRLLVVFFASNVVFLESPGF